MSRIPSSSEQFLGGLASSQGFLQQAGANQRAKMDYQLAQQQMGLEQQKMQQQGQQFQQGLQAEAENYRKLNESRERMAQAEMQQQGSQFGQRMSFDKEQANMERLVGLKMQQIDMDMRRNEAEITAMADNDPRVAELRGRRRQLKADARNLEQMLASSAESVRLAQGLKADRVGEVDARLNAFQEAVGVRRSQAEDAMRSGLDYAVLKDAREGGFIKELARVAADQFGPGVAAGGPVGAGAVGVTGLAIIGDNLMQWAMSVGSPELAEVKATQFMKDGSAMAVQVVNNALALNGDAFGLKPGKREEATKVLSDIVAKGAILANMDPQSRASNGGGQQQLKQEIAQGVAQLRQAGMGDEQIAAVFEGLESMSENRAELLRSYEETDPQSLQAGLLEASLTRVGKIQDAIESVVADQDVMKGAGGKLVDHSKYDWAGVSRNARLAYGMGQSSELQQLVRDLDSLGMTDQELNQITRVLTESDPNLQYLRPEDLTSMIRGMSMRAGNVGADIEDIGEEIGQAQGQVVARGRLQGLNEADQRLAELIGRVGG
jgi:hypothetical protein